MASMSFVAWLGCLGLSGPGDRDPWAASFGQLAYCELQRCLGASPVDSSVFCTPPGYWNADDLSLEITDAPNIWTDGSGAGVYLLASGLAFESAVWGMAEEHGDSHLERCRAFMPVPGPLQTVQRAEFWGAILALQAYWPCHLGIDNLNVARSMGGLLDHDCLAKPLPIVKDGDLVAIAQYMIQARVRDTVRVTKVKGHATDADVEHGPVRLADKVNNAEADAAADLCRPHQCELVMDTWRALLGDRNHWYPVILDLHRSMVAVSQVAVNHDGRGGSAPDPLVWDQGSKRKQRKTHIRVNVDLASLPGPPGF